MSFAVDEASAGPKLCECGCGKPTRPYRKTRRNLGQVAGQPGRFLPSHRRNAVLRPRPEEGEGAMLRQGRMRYDEILDEWEWLRGHVAWQFFGERVGIKFATWRDMFNAAAKAGDPRAVKHWRDEP